MVCCVTGHRPEGFPFSREETNVEYVAYKKRLITEITELIQQGYSSFIFGVADGADTDFANTVIFLRDKVGYDISLEAALPCPIRVAKSPTGKTLDRINLLNLCDKVHTVSPNYHRGCMQKRNEYMINKADLVLAIWNENQKGGTWNSIKYALKTKTPIKYIMLNNLLPN